MSTVTAILEADADGSIHLPVPEGMRAGKIRVVASLEPVDEASCTKEQKLAAFREWVEKDQGSVRLEPGETEDDVRMDYYTKKYRLK